MKVVMSKNDENQYIWSQALKVCKDYISLNNIEAITAINLLDINDEVKQKAIKVITDRDSDFSLLDSKKLGMTLNLDSQLNDDNLIGKEIGSYKIIKLIAKGGMSVVYKAINTNSSRHKPVALKILSPYVFSNKSVELFNREQLILSKLEHPNIISFHHSGKTNDGTNYLVMEYIDSAQEITHYAKSHNLSIKQILQIILNAANVLAYTHNNLIIHRDIKPSNLLIDKIGNLKVIDFGIGQITYKTGNTSTQVFTLDTASPEQIQGGNVNIQTDIFSLGAVLLQLLVKKPPLPKINIATYNPQDDVKYIAQLLKNSHLDADLKNIIFSATHIDVTKRYSSMEAFANDLSNWQNNRPIAARADSKWYKSIKFIQRNPLTVLLSFVFFISMMSAVFIYKNMSQRAQILADNAKKEAQKSEKTLNFLTHIFDLVDPFKSGDSQITLLDALDKSDKIPLSTLGGDKELKTALHIKLAEIYFNIAHEEKSLEQYQQAVSLMNENRQQYGLEIIYAKIQMSQIMLEIGRLDKAVEMNENLIETIIEKYPSEKDLLASSYAILLKAYSQINSNYTYDEKKNDEVLKILILLVGNDEIIANEVKLSVFDSLSQTFSKLKNYERAEFYLSKSLSTLEAMNQQDSVSYYIYKLNLAYLYTLQKEYIKAEDLTLLLINQLNNKDPNNSFLANVYENYASLLFDLDRKEESLKALTNSLKISEVNKNTMGLYQSYARRAMYYSRYNQFNLALKDQLKVIPLTVNLSGNDSQRTLAHMVNLSLLLYALNHPKYANLIIKKAIQTASQVDKPNNKVIHLFYLMSSLSNWQAGLKQIAINDLENSFEYKENDNNLAIESLANYIISNKTNVKDSLIKPAKQSIIQSTYHLLQIKDGLNPTQLSSEQLNQYCQVSPKFRKTKFVTIKKLLLNTCIELYKINKFEVPIKIYQESDEMLAIPENVLLFDETKLNQEISTVLKLF